MRRRQHPNIDALRANTAQSLKFLLLQDSQELGLQFGRYIADLIQEQRSLVRQFESSNLLGYGAGVLSSKEARIPTEPRGC